jgi:glycosyltransferase involved in cell wall biosynthesis
MQMQEFFGLGRIRERQSMSIQKLHLITSTFPPRICGVGDHTAHLSAELAKTVEVKVLTAYGKVDAPLGVKAEQIFTNEQPSSIFSVVEAISADMPDWVILQYDPFSYGARYGFNPYLPLALNLLKRRCPQVRIGLIVHESFVPIRNWKSVVLSSWLKAQLWALGRVADAIFIVIEPWIPILKSWFPNKTVQHLPVSSNMPLVPTCRDEIRARLGISPQTIVLGLFGRIQRTRSLEHVIKAVNRSREAGFDVVLLYSGLDLVAARNCLSSVPLIADGPLTAPEISQRFAAMDVFLVPIDEGVSTRRTSLMTGLQHGVPTVATFGLATDSVLMGENGKSLILSNVKAPDDFADAVLDLVSKPSSRKVLSEGAQQLFSREFSWNQIGAKLLSTLESCLIPE